MTGNKKLFTTFENYNGGNVCFADGDKAKVIGKGTVLIPCVSKLSSVYLVEGLKTNSLNISQWCDNQHEVHFSANECIIIDKKGKIVLHGKRNADDCYIVAIENDLSCHSAMLSDINLWHQRLDHVNHKDLGKLSKHELV